MLNKIERSQKVAVSVVCWILILLAVIFFIRYFYNVFAIITISVAITYILLWPTKAIERLLPSSAPNYRAFNKRILAAIITYVATAVISIVLIALMIQPVSKQIIELTQAIPKNILEIEHRAIDFVNTMSSKHGITVFETILENSEETEQQPTISTLPEEDKKKAQAAVLESKISKQLERIAKEGVLALPDLVSITLRHIIYAIMIAIISFYFIIEEQGFRDWIFGFFKDSAASEKLRVVECKIHKALYGYIKGQTIIGVLTGVSMWLVYKYFGLKFALVLAILMGVGQFVPFVGQALAIIAAMIVAIAQDPFNALLIFIAFVAFQIFSNNILVPILLGDLTGIHPVMVIMSLVVGEKLAGILGVFLAVPVASIIMILIRHYLPGYSEGYTPEECIQTS